MAPLFLGNYFRNPGGYNSKLAGPRAPVRACSRPMCRRSPTLVELEPELTPGPVQTLFSPTFHDVRVTDSCASTPESFVTVLLTVFEHSTPLSWRSQAPAPYYLCAVLVRSYTQTFTFTTRVKPFKLDASSAISSFLCEHYCPMVHRCVAEYVSKQSAYRCTSTSCHISFCAMLSTFSSR